MPVPMPMKHRLGTRMPTCRRSPSSAEIASLHCVAYFPECHDPHMPSQRLSHGIIERQRTGASFPVSDLASLIAAGPLEGEEC